MLIFGDTFRHREKEYVYLAQTGDILYAALILPQDESRELNKYSSTQIKNGAKTGIMLTKPLYCFVVLNTEEFKDRVAHIGFSDQHESTVDECGSLNPTGKLNNFDLKQIKQEIDGGAVPQDLKELTKSILL